MICFDVDIEPVAQKRHRHASRGKFVQVYDPSKLDKLALLDSCMEFAPDEPFDGALSVYLTFTFTRPKASLRITAVPPTIRLRKQRYGGMNSVFRGYKNQNH